MPDGVALFEPPDTPVPVLLAEPVAGVAGGAGVADEAGSGRPPARGNALLVPGFTGSKEDYIALLMPLAERGWRVAAMDLPGQGGVPGLGPRGAHTPQSLADAVARVADWLSPIAPVHLVGHSMGGLVTREVVIAHPERLLSWVPMCSGPGRVPSVQDASLRQLQLALAAMPIEQVWAQKEAIDRAGGWTPPNDEVARFVAERFVRNDPAALSDFAEILITAEDRTDLAAAAMAGGRIDGRRIGSGGMAGPRIGGAVLTGETDDAWPLAQQEQMARRLGVPWLLTPGGHNPAVDDPDATAAALDSVWAAAESARASRR